jgi:hypothetical protein
MVGVPQDVSWTSETSTLDMPPSFSSLAEARECLDLCYNICVRDFGNFEYSKFLAACLTAETPQSWILVPTTQDPTIQAARTSVSQKCEDMLSHWAHAFESYAVASKRNLDPAQRRGILSLKLLHRMAQLHLKVFKTIDELDETIWDDHQTLFEEVVSLATSLVDSASTLGTAPSTPTAQGKGKGNGPTFTLDSGIVTPMYLVATKCRDPHVRRQAIALLHSAGRQEGVWNGAVIASVCERFVEMEEAGLGEVRSCKDVPAYVRLSRVSPKFDITGRRAEVSYVRDRAQDFETEVIEW